MPIGHTMTPEDFAARLLELGTRRAVFAWDAEARRVLASHPALEDLAATLQSDRDYDGHEAIFLEVAPETGALFGVFVHRTVRGQAAGGARHWPYPTLGAFLQDGLRLAVGMGRKNALAGLWWGGGKAVIARQPGERWRDGHYRHALYREFGAFVTSLRGCYVTAEDVGTQGSDMAEIFRATRFVTCVPPELGGSGNPSFATARGTVCAMEGALDALGLGALAGKRIAMQGVGNVGQAMIDELLARGVREIVACDLSGEQLAAATDRFAGKPVTVRLARADDASILAERCDILAPNALGGVLNPETIPRIRAKIVCGAANNQLLDDRRDDQALADRGVTYVPDYVANRMGIVTCANEQYGVLPDDPAIARHLGRDWENAIFVVVRRILERARAEGTTTTRAANALADELSGQPHPIWGHRAKAIIDSLIAGRWHERTPLRLSRRQGAAAG